jgi:hypothetical protein
VIIVDIWYLGIHRPNWLSDSRLAEVPVFISRRTFLDRRTGEYRRTFPKAVGRYAVDSGGFTELQQYGRWTITPAQYVAFLRRLWAETGPFDFAAPQDWMCEPAVINGGWFVKQHFAGTGLSVVEHQRLTVDNFVQLRNLAPDLPIVPVLQGWAEDDYLRCVDMYASAGVDLTAEPVVGLGSVCRRQDTDEAGFIIDSIRERGIRTIHGFGFKIEGLRNCWHQLATADSLAASKDGRHAGPCQHPPYAAGVQPKSEANCLPYFLAWRRRHIKPPIRRRPRQQQLDLLAGVA